MNADTDYLNDLGRENASPQSDAAARLLKSLHSGEAIEAIEVPPPLVDGYIACGSLAMLVGKWKSLKSFLAIDLAAHIATGRDWCGRPVVEGHVLYVLLEGSGDIAYRYRAWRTFANEGKHVERLHLLTAPVSLISESDTGALIDLMAVLPEVPVLVVIDTLARAIGGGDENGTDMGRLIANADRIRHETGSAVLLVHHHGKSTEAGARGHSSLPGAVDSELTTSRAGHVLNVKHTLSKYYPEADPILFRTVSHEGSLVLQHDPNGGGESALTDSAALLLRVMRDTSPTTAVAPGRIYTWICDDANEAGRVPISDRTFRRALDVLCDAGHLTRGGSSQRPVYKVAEFE
jgi:RecA-family ATPase